MSIIGGAAGALTNEAAKRIVVQMVSAMEDGGLAVRFPNGSTRTFGTPGAQPSAGIQILDDAFYKRVLLHGEIGFGEAYMDGLWRSDDMVRLFELAIANRKRIQLNSTLLARVSRLKNVRLHRGRINTKDKARENIHAHYDLGNEFFRLFLDETMTYSCAFFQYPDEPLADAQRNKYRMLCEKVDLRSSDHLLEIGSGWGGFAMFAAENYGCRVTTITISNEQLALAKERVAAAGLSSLIDVEFRDYRDVRGTYDKIVSIEMFEAVGADYFEEFFRCCDRVLRPGGRMSLQTISVPDRSFAPMRNGVNWIQKYIFPGGMLPSIAEIERALHPTQLVIGALEDIGPHYAVTLRRWRERFMSELPAVRALGVDDRFIRTWEFYLAVCEAGFLARNTGDLQIVFEKPAGRALPAWYEVREPETATV